VPGPTGYRLFPSRSASASHSSLGLGRQRKTFYPPPFFAFKRQNFSLEFWQKSTPSRWAAEILLQPINVQVIRRFAWAATSSATGAGLPAYATAASTGTGYGPERPSVAQKTAFLRLPLLALSRRINNGGPQPRFSGKSALHLSAGKAPPQGRAGRVANRPA